MSTMAAVMLIAGAVACAVAGWITVDWWTVKRPLIAPTEHGRELRLARINDDRPLRYRCLDCGSKIRKTGWNPSWDNPLPSTADICKQCIINYPDRDDWAQWMSFDVIRTI